MMPTPPTPKRIHLILPALTDEQAALLLDACTEITELLWHIHGDFLGDLCERRVEHTDVQNPDTDHVYALPESGEDDSDIDF